MGVKDYSQFLPSNSRPKQNDLVPIHLLSIAKNDKKEESPNKRSPRTLNNDLTELHFNKVSLNQ